MFRKAFRHPASRRLILITSSSSLVASYYLLPSHTPLRADSEPHDGFKIPPRGRSSSAWLPPDRKQMIRALKRSSTTIGPHPAAQDEEEYDLLIIGGGASGAGVAVDAASRGLKVALVDRDDFSSGTSSKSTKLVHGGVRYLQKAVLELDYEQYKLVREALHERKIFLQTAPYLSHMLPIMLPIYKYWQLPYYWAGCKAYDLLAGSENMESSYLMSKGKALEAFPMLKADGLVGALVYYDGQHNDSRMNMALVLTAVQYGAVVANYVEVNALDKTPEGKICGARVKDNISGDEWHIRAKGVINATGPFSDAILSLDASSSPHPTVHNPIVAPSSGVHITLPNYYSPRTMGLLDPATSDGRVIFFLPWQGNTIAGTTDSPSSVEKNPKPKEEDIAWILDEVKRYLSPDIKVRRGDVLSAWSGLRPLVKDPSASSSANLVRNHLIHVSSSGLITLAGGKWTTYRAMAEETVDRAIKELGLNAGKCESERVRLVGSVGWSSTMFIRLIQQFGLETEVAKHLSDNYGDRAWTVCSMAEATGERWPLHGVRLTPLYPYIEAEVRYATRSEYAQTAEDFIARRARLSFLNAQAALEVLSRVIAIMSVELGWNASRQREEWIRARAFLESMGLPPSKDPEREARAALQGTTLGWLGTLATYGMWASQSILRLGMPASGKISQTPAALLSRAHFSSEEMNTLRHIFAETGGDQGRMDTKTLHAVLAELGFKDVSFEELHKVLTQRGVSHDGVSFEYFLDVCSELKEKQTAPITPQRRRGHIPVEKSGGGV
ncbi:hypothetical protein BOTBODRAFT_32138 [Botryobasidium botryosum FD-172 SS1]|uniref:Glycerol-3-phosphate dehydrogenase n=1 Tax=Botryobasidium botryosum (strain FD-172 SS1) TaxID=930990 RepID=A0A067MHX0_BOTB1|nr:hypothetical protein BOTBODRAFT_32138 [Botryobasidium botryosum FD-172 SS1]